MAGPARNILDELAPATLRRLCVERELPTGGDGHEKRSRLAHSFRGDVAALIERLRREEMISALEGWEFSSRDGHVGALVGLTVASKAQLRKVMTRVYRDDWTAATERSQPCGAGFPVRVAWFDSADDEVDDGDDEDQPGDLDDDGDEDAPEDGAPDDDGVDDVEDDEDGAPVDEDRPAITEDGDLESEFIAWMRARLSERGSTNVLIKTIVNRLGRYRAERRLSTAAVRDVAQVLARAGLMTDPDLTQVDRSPGIEARVRISTRSSVRTPTVEWTPVPPPPTGSTRPPPRPPRAHPAITSEFERAATKLKFLVTVAAAVHRLGERERSLAVERVGRGASLSAADWVRLRAMAHQYAGGHEDVNPSIRQLREALGVNERRELLSALRELAPPTSALEELVAAYAFDLGVDQTASAVPPPASPVVAPPSTEIKQGAAPPDIAAGGLRDNAALDDIFGRSNDTQ